MYDAKFLTNKYQLFDECPPLPISIIEHITNYNNNIEKYGYGIKLDPNIIKIYKNHQLHIFQKPDLDKFDTFAKENNLYFTSKHITQKEKKEYEEKILELIKAKRAAKQKS